MTTEILNSSSPVARVLEPQIPQTEGEKTTDKIKCLLASAFSIFAGTAIALLWSVPIGLLGAAAGIGLSLFLLSGSSQKAPIQPPIQPPENNREAPVATAKRFSAARNVEIYNETMAYAKENLNTIRDFLVIEDSGYPSPLHTPIADARVYVANKSTLRMTQDLVQRGLRPLVLDMANAYAAGGGVRHGANAQEEILCRQSNLMLGLLKAEERRAFPIPEEGGILIPNVTFFRADPNEDYQFLNEYFDANVFASAAYCCRTDNSDRPGSDEEYRANTKAKILTFFRTAVIFGNDSIVASAFGCGAFQNDPSFIATLFKEVLETDEFKGRFKEVAFGIIEDLNSEGRKGNYQTFKEILDPQ